MIYPPRMWHAMGPALVLACLCATALAAPEGGAMPVLLTPPGGERHVGKIVLRELTSNDLAASKAFYGGLFGWTFEDVPGIGRGYCVARRDGQVVAGIVAGAPGTLPRQPTWIPYLSVADVDRSRRDALRRGAHATRDARTYLPRGRQALLMDPDGAAFGLLASFTGDPPDVLSEPGEWIWSSLLSAHVEQDTAFYQGLFGYAAFELEPGADSRHAILADENFARASVNSLPNDGLRRHPHWLGFVRVDSVAHTAALAAELGGHIVVEPRTDRHGSPFAVLTDPGGAPFGIMEWVPGEDVGAAK